MTGGIEQRACSWLRLIKRFSAGESGGVAVGKGPGSKYAL